MNGLSCGEESMTIYSAVLIQYQRVTDGGRTDRHTDVQPISITSRFSIADARKNTMSCMSHMANVTNVTEFQEDRAETSASDSSNLIC